MSFFKSIFGGGDSKSEPPSQPAPPVVNDEDPATLTDKEKAKRLGRLQLVATGPRGLLENPTTAKGVLSAI